MAYKAQIIPIKVSFDSTGRAYISTIANCIRYAADRGAKVVNVSFEGLGNNVIFSAAQYAASKGALVVYAAGNSGQLKNIPNTSSIIAVSATDMQNKRAGFSNYGPFVDVAAPGVSLVSTLNGSNYAFGSGTSYSAPMVAGVIAMMLSAKPNLNISQINTILRRSSTDLGRLGYDAEYGHGLLNAGKAVEMARDYR